MYEVQSALSGGLQKKRPYDGKETGITFYTINHKSTRKPQGIEFILENKGKDYEIDETIEFRQLDNASIDGQKKGSITLSAGPGKTTKQLVTQTDPTKAYAINYVTTPVVRPKGSKPSKDDKAAKLKQPVEKKAEKKVAPPAKDLPNSGIKRLYNGQETGIYFYSIEQLPIIGRFGYEFILDNRGTDYSIVETINLLEAENADFVGHPGVR